jgi:trimeric autotransporter adhesin
MRTRSRGVSRAARVLALLLLTTCTDNPFSTPPSSVTENPPPPAFLGDVTTGPQVLIGAGNIARCDRTNDEATGLLLNNYPTATIFTTGDNTNGNASLTDFNNCYQPSWGANGNKARTRPAVGENDYKQTAASGFYNYFKPNAGDSAKYYYSYNLGGWHIMVLNDRIAMTVGSPQELWLRAELAANTRQCTLAYWDRPRFTSTGSNNLAAVKPLWDALYAYNTDIVVNGHPFAYERFAPQSPTAVADPLGIREFIVGTGGVNLTNPGPPRANSQVRQGTTYGVLKFTLDTASYAWDFVPVAGGSFTDTGTGTCHTRIGVASVDVTPTSASLNPGGTVQLTATPRDANGTPLTGRTVTWTSSNATVASVSATGLVTANAAGGPVTITATSEGKTGTSSITVTLVPVASIDLTPATATIHPGETSQLTATTKDANGNVLTGRTITWGTSNPGVATVSATGLVTGVAVGGPITITASSEGQSATSAITVIPIPVASVAVSPATGSIVAGTTLQLSATPKDANGNPLTGRTVTWTSSDANIATVDANGLVTGNVVGGPVIITATSEGKSGTASITVTPVPVATVDVTPPTASMVIGGTAQLTATPKDANGNPLTGRSVTWSTANGNIATVDANGLVTGTGVGTVTITAKSEGQSGTASVMVALVPVATVDVSPSSATIQVGATVQLTATLKDANGNTLTGRTVTWETADANIATVDANGLVTAQNVGGPITITATSEGKSKTASITVIPVPVASVTVAPATATIAVNATVQLAATTKDANGNTLTGRTVTWATSNSNTATVDGNGLVTGKAAGGPVTITATSEGKSGTAAVTVSLLVPVASVSVTPATASIHVGETVQLTGTPKDGSGNPLTGRTVTWASADANIASVDANGLVTAHATGGPVTITATSEGKNGTAAVTVLAIPVANVAVSPATPSIPTGGTVQLTAALTDANGNPLTGRAVTWQTSAPAIAIVDASGLVQGVAVGSATITATSEGKSGTAVVSVTQAPVASVVVSPATASVVVNGTVQFTATPKDAGGTPLSGRLVTWASSDASIATVNNSGFVVGLVAGQATIRATSEGIVGTASLTVQPASGPPVIAGAGDIADCSRASQEATAKVLDNIPGTVITLGDMAYENGSMTDFMQCYDPSWGRHKARTRPSPGNHEYNLGNANGYFQYFGAAAGDPTKGYYSYDLGAWHLIVINRYVDMSAGSPQEQWLRADLASHNNVCTLAYWHQPRFSSGGNGSDLSTQPIWQALYDYGADVVLNGHDHDYERFAPQTPTGQLDNARGIKEFVVGTGGNSLYAWPGNPIANSELRSNVNYGVIKLTLWPTSYDWQFVPVAGGSFTDQGSASCHSGTPLPNQAPVANPGGPYAAEGTFTLDGTQSRDPDNNTPLTYAWDLGDGTTATTPTVTHTYPADGHYVVTLTVRDSKGLASAPASTAVTIGNVAPTANAGPDQSVVATTALTLNATFTDANAADGPWTYAITWGDGATGSGSVNALGPITASHVYTTPGQYTARLTVTDKDGAAGSDDIIVKALDPATIQIFSGASNIATCGSTVDDQTAQILDGLPGQVFVLGDNVNPSGSAANYTNCYTPTWGRHKARTRAVVGNHEYDVAGASAFYNYFKPGVGDSAKYYYSFDIGPNWHVVVLNNTASVSFATGSVEEQWLKADLAANTKKCTIAMFHYPLFFSSDDPSWHSTSSVIPLWLDLYAANADIVLNGQEYMYERMAPQDAGGSPDPARGIREFQVGTGGYATSLPSSLAPNSEVVSDAFGILKLTLGTDSYIWDFIPAPGYTFTDHGSGNCH